MNKYSTIRQDVLDERVSVDLAQLFGTLSDPTRVRMISVLAEGETSVKELADAVGISESAASHQLRILRAMRVVRGRREGRQIFYTLEDEHIADLYTRGLDHIRHG